MLLGLASRLHQDRRRLIFVTLMAFFAGFIMYLPADLYVGFWHVSWITGAIYAAVVGTVAALICLFVPSMRFMIEAVAISRLVFSLLVLALPGFGAFILSDPFLMAGVIVAGGWLISRLLHGRILKERATGWARVWPAGGFQRKPVQLIATPLQSRFVAWIDNAAPELT